MTMPAATGCSGQQCRVTVRVRFPAKDCSVLGGKAAPVVVFFNGFQGTASQYTTYATKLSQYGYAVVQYDTRSSFFSGTLTDKIELPFMDNILSQLRALATSPSHPLAGIMDFDQLAVAGHSRGGKLAALHLADAARVPQVKAAYLLDPVDNTQFSPESADSPSAAKALAAANPKRIAGITGAGIVGSCNPQASNYQRFYDQLGAGSWQQVLLGAGHAAFGNTGVAGSLFCGAGSLSSQAVMSVSATTMTAWFENQIRNVPMPSSQLQAWIDRNVQQGTLTFTVKE